MLAGSPCFGPSIFGLPILSNILKIGQLAHLRRWLPLLIRAKSPFIGYPLRFDVIFRIIFFGLDFLLLGAPIQYELRQRPCASPFSQKTSARRALASFGGFTTPPTTPRAMLALRRGEATRSLRLRRMRSRRRPYNTWRSEAAQRSEAPPAAEGC